MTSKQKAQFLFLFLAAIWGIFIFYLSSVPDLASNLPREYDFILRKIAHISVFLVLTYFVAASLGQKKRGYLLFVVLSVVAYALTDEVHQSYIPGRVGSAVDILIDTLGIFFGILLYQYRSPEKVFRKLK